jgi:hypothetical protein
MVNIINPLKPELVEIILMLFVSVGWDYVSELLSPYEYGATVEWYWQGKQEVGEKTWPSATVSTTNRTWIDPDSNPDLQWEADEGYLSHVTASVFAHFCRRSTAVLGYRPITARVLTFSPDCHTKRIPVRFDNQLCSSDCAVLVWRAYGVYSRIFTHFFLLFHNAG